MNIRELARRVREYATMEHPWIPGSDADLIRAASAELDKAITPQYGDDKANNFMPSVAELSKLTTVVRTSEEGRELSLDIHIDPDDLGSIVLQWKVDGRHVAWDATTVRGLRS